jgi:hypothetical protein
MQNFPGGYTVFRHLLPGRCFVQVRSVPNYWKQRFRKHVALLCWIAAAVAVVAMADRSAVADEPATVEKLGGVKEPGVAKTPQRVIPLFNGKNLDGFYSWLTDTGYEDPRKVFTVRDRVLHISGDGYGYLATNDAYQNYKLVAEFKWGQRTWAARKDKTKDSGILVHASGKDGANGNWLPSLECQIIEGGVGDFIVIGGKDSDGKPLPVSLTCEVRPDRDGESVWHRGGQRKTFTGGRINWFGRDPDWVDKLGFRGRQDVERPDGQWNRMEVFCRGDRIRVFVNGVLVNEGFDAEPQSGRILVQTELAELMFRKLELHPLPKGEDKPDAEPADKPDEKQ